MKFRIAVAHVIDSRPDFAEVRIPLVVEENCKLEWLRNEFDCLESSLLNNETEITSFYYQAAAAGVNALIVVISVWADPIFALRISQLLKLPTLLLGNSRPETSSLVGVLGAGGALDQIGIPHMRVFDHSSQAGQEKVRSFVGAARAISQLKGQTLGLFGGYSLGIFTANADPSQALRLFGVKIEHFDQLEIQQIAEGFSQEEVDRHKTWLVNRLASVTYSKGFTPLTLERQVRSYLATRSLIKERGLDFIGVKCQPEMSDGYVSQCVAHMLSNGSLDADGEKEVRVHACESDADGALTMQVLHLLSNGESAALLDIRYFEAQRNRFTLANCGAVPAAFCGTADDPSGLSNIRMEAHVFGKGGGGALPALMTPRPVTLARLCRKNGKYWMAVVSGKIDYEEFESLKYITPSFPKGVVVCNAGEDFLQEFGANHIHMVSGDRVEALKMFCELIGIPCRVW
jgi:L-fucose isomerase